MQPNQFLLLIHRAAVPLLPQEKAGEGAKLSATPWLPAKRSCASCDAEAISAIFMAACKA